MSNYERNAELRMWQLRHVLDEANRFQRCAEAALTAFESEKGESEKGESVKGESVKGEES